MKRYISIDILKGFCMFLVIFFHVLTRSLDMNIIEDTLSEFTPIYLPLYCVIVILGYISQFDLVFICISGFGNIFSVQRQWERLITQKSSLNDRKEGFRAIMRTQLIRGGFIAILGYVSEWFFNGMIVDLISQNPNWVTSSISAFFFAQILTVMGLSNIFLSFVYLMLLRNRKEKSIQMVLLGLFIGFLVVTPGIIELIKLNPVLWNSLEIGWEHRTVGMNILLFFLNPFIRRHTPIFPNFSASALGAIMAYKFSQEGVKKKFINWMVLISIVLQLVGLGFAYFEYQGYQRIRDYNLGSFLFAYSGTILFILFFLYFFEVHGSKKVIAYSKFWRRLGIFTLTLWCTQWLIIFPAWLIQIIINWISGTWTDFVNSPLINNGLTMWQFLIALVFIIGFYHGILLLWEKIQYIGTFEWLTVKLISSTYGNAKNRLDMVQSLYNVESFIPERIKYYKSWQLTIGILLFCLFAVIHAMFYLI
ncbi:MAG: hypothetical protein JW776_04905 [Candidatus Lokiarchaeota archaeon]|nr:hypothetical protein [Candidatus Lokiarchaeota archaeon]